MFSTRLWTKKKNLKATPLGMWYCFQYHTHQKRCGNYINIIKQKQKNPYVKILGFFSMYLYFLWMPTPCEKMAGLPSNDWKFQLLPFRWVSRKKITVFRSMKRIFSRLPSHLHFHHYHHCIFIFSIRLRFKIPTRSEQYF